MPRRISLLGFWLVLVLLASGCEPARVFSVLQSDARIAHATAPAPQPARSNGAPVSVPATPTPQPTAVPAPVPLREYANIAYAQAPDTDPNLLSLDIYTPAKTGSGHPVMIYVHGGGWSSGDKKEVNHKPQFFVDSGFIFVSVNYRLTPKVKFPTHAYDLAEAVAWVYKNIAQYGGDPHKISLMGHSAGAHLAVLISTDDRYLQAQGLSFKNIRSVISLDTAGYDLTVFAGRCKGSKLPEPYGATFGQVPADLRSASPSTYITGGKNIPAMMIVYSGDVGIGSSVSRELMAQEFSLNLTEAGVPHDLRGALEKNHSDISTDFGKAGDRLSEQVLDSLKKIAPDAFLP